MSRKIRITARETTGNMLAGYTYPKNATDEEKAKIDAQERYLWEEAGRPGS